MCTKLNENRKKGERGGGKEERGGEGGSSRLEVDKRGGKAKRRR